MIISGVKKIFKNKISSELYENNLVLSRFAKADMSLEPDAFCTAYINFINYEDVYLFQERFDGYVFVDNKGNHLKLLRGMLACQH